jgi:predicted nucleotidyltransferase
MTTHQKNHEFLEKLAKDYCLESIYVFGSRAEDVAAVFDGLVDALPASQSDVDIGVKPKPGISLSVSAKVELAQQCEDLLGVHRVDCLIIPEADPFLAANIIRGQRLYEKDKHAADEYELYILRRAGDCLPLERERLALIMGEEA